MSDNRIKYTNEELSFNISNFIFDENSITDIDHLIIYSNEQTINFYNCQFLDTFLLGVIEGYQEIKVNLKFVSCDFDKALQIENFIFLKGNSNFQLENCTINELKIYNGDFNSIFELHNVKIENKAIFQEVTFSDLTLFDKCTFQDTVDFEFVGFDNYAYFRGSTFQKGINLDYTHADKGFNFFGVKGLDTKESIKNTSQETYRIIKHNFDKLGNKIEANKYHALELTKKRNYLWEKWKGCDFSFKPFSEGLVFFAHWLSSNHSTNWILPLFWMFIVSLITNYNINDVLNINDIFQYSSLLNSSENFKINDKIDYRLFSFNKVSLGYLYYQFLTAIRKDTRK